MKRGLHAASLFACLLSAALATDRNPAVAQSVSGESGDLLTSRVEFSRPELERILRHGPWPPAWKKDPSNRMSGEPAAIALGRSLFFEPRLSGTATVSCATCHLPERSFTDGRRRVGDSAEDHDASLGCSRESAGFDVNDWAVGMGT